MFNVDLTTYGIDQIDKKPFKEILALFYVQVLCQKEHYDDFCKLLKTVMEKDVPTKTKQSNLQKLIKCTIMQSPACKKPRHLVNLASKAIAHAYNLNNNIFKNAFEGGKYNFSYYVELIIAKIKPADLETEFLLEDEINNVIKDMQELRYFRHNAPDQLLK